MFSRAAKSIVKTIGQRRYHAGEDNVKVAMVGGEIGRSLSQMLKQTSKLDVLALYDVAASKKTFSSIPVRFHSFSNGEPLNPNNSRMLTMLGKSRFGKDGQQSEALQQPVGYFSTRVSNIPQNETEELVETLRRLPIAEECATDQAGKTNKIASQGDNELRGPRVLGEMGPDKFLHDGRIVSEICRQLPNLAVYLRKDCSRSVNDASRRQLSSFATYSNEGSSARDGTCIEMCPKSCPRNSNEIPSATKAWTVEKVCRRSQSRRKDAKKLITASSEQTVEKRQLIEMDDASMRMEKFEKKKVRSKKLKESRTAEQVPVQFDKRPSSARKLRNWTIPAAISDKKPRTLYGSVHQRQTSITWFFSKLLDVQNSDTADGYRDRRYRSYKIGRLGCIQNQKLFKEVNHHGNPYAKSLQGDRLNASTSMSDLTPSRLEETTHQALDRGSRSPEQSEAENSKSVQQSLQDPEAMDEKVLAASSNEDSDCDTISNIDEPQKPVRKMSSKIALFLKNLMINRQKSWSLSTLASYNLDSLFAVQEATPALNYVASKPVLFSCKDSGSKSSLRDKLCNKFCGKKDRKDEDICKKRRATCKTKKDGCKRSEEGKSCSEKRKEAVCKGRGEDTEKKSCESTCGDGDNDPCRNVRQEKTYGPSCKKYQADERYGKEDPCKKHRNEASHGKSCKMDAEAEDPCKKYRKTDTHGKLCKQCGVAHGKHDPCDKFWRDDVHGARCKGGKQKKKKPDRCGERNAKSCDRNKKQDPCKVEDKTKCGTTKKSEKSCRKSCDRDKKQDPCKVEDKSKCGATKKSEKKDCPPVFRAPDCPKDEGKSGGSGKGSSCRGFATVASRIHF